MSTQTTNRPRKRGRSSDRLDNWNPLLPDLLTECRKGGGAITDHYVAGMMEIATKAVPIIDELEPG